MHGVGAAPALTVKWTSARFIGRLLCQTKQGPRNSRLRLSLGRKEKSRFLGSKLYLLLVLFSAAENLWFVLLEHKNNVRSRNIIFNYNGNGHDGEGEFYIKYFLILHVFFCKSRFIAPFQNLVHYLNE